MKRIEISSPYVDTDSVLDKLRVALGRGQMAQGPIVAEVEESMVDAFDAGYAAALANGTASLRTALVASVTAKHAVDKKFVDRYLPEKEVIVPAFSFNATLNTVMQVGATACVVDINADDFCLDRKQALDVMSEKTVAIMPVDLYGQPADISSADTEFSNIAVVRDSAQAHGATLRGEAIVHHGDATSLSFYPTKNISAPEGGAVLTDNREIDEIVRIYRNQGMAQRYVYEMAGDNLRMSDIHAAILSANLGSLAIVTARRQENATLLSQALEDVEGIRVPALLDGRGHVWHQYTILVEDDFGVSRDQLAQKLNENGIGSGVYYPTTMTDHETFRNHPRIVKHDTPVADSVAKKVLSLPVHPGVGLREIDRIADTVVGIKNGRL